MKSVLYIIMRLFIHSKKQCGYLQLQFINITFSLLDQKLLIF